MQQQYVTAEQAYGKAFAARPTPVVAQKLHAAGIQAGHRKEADEKLLQWLREHPADTGTRLYLANAYVNLRESQSAIQQYEVVLKQDPKNFLAMNNLATLYYQAKDRRALDYLERSYQLKPDNVTVSDNLAWALVEQGKLPRALELLRKAASQA